MLIQQNRLFIKLVESAFDNLVDNLVGLARILWIVPGLGARDLSFLVQISHSHFFARDKSGLGCRDMHGNVFYQLLKLFAARYEVGLAVHFDQDSDLATHVDVRPDNSLSRNPALSLLGGCQSPFSE